MLIPISHVLPSMEPQTGFVNRTVVCKGPSVDFTTRMVASQHRRVPQERIMREVLEKAVDQVKDRAWHARVSAHAQVLSCKASGRTKCICELSST